MVGGTDTRYSGGMEQVTTAEIVADVAVELMRRDESPRVMWNTVRQFALQIQFQESKRRAAALRHEWAKIAELERQLAEANETIRELSPVALA